MFRVEYTDKDGWNRFALVAAPSAKAAEASLQRAEKGTATIQRTVSTSKDAPYQRGTK